MLEIPLDKELTFNECQIINAKHPFSVFVICLVHIKGIFSDSNNIFLQHRSEDVNKKKGYFQHFSGF